MKAYSKPEIIETELLCADVIATSTVNVSDQAYEVKDGETIKFAADNAIQIDPFK